jgi:hypothetical protein
MLKNLGKLSLLLRLGRRVFVCMPNKRLDGDMRERIHPTRIGPLACWCDKSA